MIAWKLALTCPGSLGFDSIYNSPSRASRFAWLSLAGYSHWASEVQYRLSQLEFSTFKVRFGMEALVFKQSHSCRASKRKRHFRIGLGTSYILFLNVTTNAFMGGASLLSTLWTGHSSVLLPLYRFSFMGLVLICFQDPWILSSPLLGHGNNNPQLSLSIQIYKSALKEDPLLIGTGLVHGLGSSGFWPCCLPSCFPWWGYKFKAIISQEGN